jgi:hypothetical protein
VESALGKAWKEIATVPGEQNYPSIVSSKNTKKITEQKAPFHFSPLLIARFKSKIARVGAGGQKSKKVT